MTAPAFFASVISKHERLVLKPSWWRLRYSASAVVMPRAVARPSATCFPEFTALANVGAQTAVCRTSRNEKLVFVEAETTARGPACYGSGVNASAASASKRRRAVGRALLRYFASLRPSQYLLWCYLVWYLFVLVRYFDANPALWFSSLGISAIVGAALYVSTARAGHTRVRLERWQLVRFFLMPFCVSSFAALIKGHGFILVFHPSPRDNVLAAFACTLFVVATRALRRRHAGD